jgi:hypothetical protein
MWTFYARYVYNVVSAEKWYFSVYTRTTGVKLHYRGSATCGEVSVCSQHPNIWLFRTSVGKCKRYNIMQHKLFTKRLLMYTDKTSEKKRITVRRCKKLLNVVTTQATSWVQNNQIL